MAAKTLLKCGYLLKRQRGLSAKADLKSLKFQQRYMRLDTKSLDYFEAKRGSRKGSFAVERIRVVENVPDVTFGKAFCFQIGDENEIMYFRAKSDKERKEWMEAFRIAINENSNEMYDWYHIGVYGQVDGKRWSCCHADKRDSKGCRKMTNAAQRPRLTSLSAHWQQQQHDGQTIPESPTIVEEFSTSMPAYPSTSNWGDNEGQDEMSEDYPPRPEDSEEGQKKKKGSHRSSIDSGLDVESRHRVGSIGSVSSSQGGSYSPMSFRRNQHRIQASSSLMVNAIPESELTSWELMCSIKLPKSQLEIASAVFRGMGTLIAASKDGYVYMIDDVDSKVHCNPEHTSATAVGRVDVWKNYLVLGFPNIQIVDLDTKEKKTLQNPTTDGNCAQFPSLTPEGQLLSYNKCEPCTICIWPYGIDSVWQNTQDNEMKADSLIIQGAQEIQSLSVSPDPDQPLMAVVVQLKGTDRRTARIYNYKTKELKQELELHEGKTKPAIAVFHPYGEYVLIGNGKSLLLYDTKRQSYLVQSVDLKNDGFITQYITSLCFYPTGSHLTIGLNTGEVKSFEGLPSSLRLVASLNKPQASTTTSSVVYSKDCQILAVGHGNGTVQLWQVPSLSILENDHDIQLLREGELTVTSDGAYFTSPYDGYIISVPPGAVPKGATITLKYGIVPHGGFSQFQFPEGMNPVSPIVSVQSTTKQKFFKPIDIAMPHFINCETPDDCDQLAVFKACHTTGENGMPTYRFEEMPKENLSLFSVRNKVNGTIMPYAAYSADHCCYWCIGTYSKKVTDKAMFCLIEARPKPTEELKESMELTIHYCLPYYLPTCLKAVEDQFPNKEYNLKHLTVVFLDDKDPAINIEFEKDLNGWNFTLQSGDKIYKKDVCFWDYPSPAVLVKMCDTRQYPPRFILDVDGRRATRSVVTKVSFPGAKEYFKRTVPFSNVILASHPQGIHHNNISGHSLASSMSEPLSSCSSISHPFQSAMAEFTDVSSVKLAFYLFSQGIITEETQEDINESASKPGYDSEELNMKLLMKVHRIIKENPLKIGAVCTALEKLKDKKDVAKKLAKDSESHEKIRVRMSCSGSAESSSSICAGSFASAQERLSDSDLHALTAAETESSSGHDHHDFEQVGDINTAESSPFHTASSQGWIPVSCATYNVIDSPGILKPFYSPGPMKSPDLILSGDET